MAVKDRRGGARKWGGNRRKRAGEVGDVRIEDDMEEKKRRRW